jgi:hypothetical protein
MNLYQYCLNNPANWTDPWGLSFWSRFLSLFDWTTKVGKSGEKLRKAGDVHQELLNENDRRYYEDPEIYTDEDWKNAKSLIRHKLYGEFMEALWEGTEATSELLLDLLLGEAAPKLQKAWDLLKDGKTTIEEFQNLINGDKTESQESETNDE